MEPSSENLAVVACTYSGYHAMKNARNLHESLSPTLNLRTLAARLFAETFHTEAAEMQLQCRRPFPLLNSFANFSQEHFPGCFSLHAEDCSPTDSQLISFAEHHLPDALRSDDFPLAGLRPPPQPHSDLNPGPSGIAPRPPPRLPPRPRLPGHTRTFGKSSGMPLPPP